MTSVVSAREEYNFPSFSDGQVNEALEKTVPLRFLPSNPLFYLILVKENVTRFFKPSALERARFDLVVSGKRLKESYLILEKGDVKNANRALTRYDARLKTMRQELEKAERQNQDVIALVDETAETLRFHEIFLSAISKKSEAIGNDSKFDSIFSGAVEGFFETVRVIDGFKAGLKDRFKSLNTNEKRDKEILPSPTPSPVIATPSARPRRIIY